MISAKKFLFVATTALAIACSSGGGGSSTPPTPPPAITIGTVNPAASTKTVGTQTTFSAVVSGTTNTALTWTATAGTFSNNVWTAPVTPGNYTVTATSVADPSKSATTTVTVVAAPKITSFSATPTRFYVNQGTTLTATFTGDTGVVNPGNHTIAGDGVTGLSVTPGMTTRYVLTVTNAAGDSVSAPLAVYPSGLGGGMGHSLAVKYNGTAWSWGANAEGELGNNSPTDSPTPVQVTGVMGDIMAIAAGARHNLALTANGTVWSWGYNHDSQLGNGSTNDRLTAGPIPVGPTGLLDGIAVAAGEAHSLAIRPDGMVMAWGWNGQGQLGDGTTAPRNVPTLASALTVPGLPGIMAIAAGAQHSLALKPDGTVWAWGDNSAGELGNGTVDALPHPTPAAVGGLTDVVAIAAGAYHSLALKADGTVWAWGSNDYGQLGNNNAATNPTPVQVGSLTGITAIAAGHKHSLALKNDGTVWAWGYNGWGQLGNGSVGNSSHPVPAVVGGLPGIVALAGGDQHSLALESNGTVWIWGYNDHGQLGNGTPDTSPHPASAAIPSFTLW